MTETLKQDRLAFLAGGGEMGERIRAFDWSSTSLGAPDQWPQSLRSAVSILLPSRAQIILFWGPDLITLYNDAYTPVFGRKHPHALGMPAREAWSEIWDVGLKDLLEGVVNTGVTYWASDRLFLLERFGYAEETFFDVSYDPVRDESGMVGGVFCIVSETTARVVGARRLRTLTALGARPVEAAQSIDQACKAAAEILSSNNDDLPFSVIYLLDSEAKRARLSGASGVAHGDPFAPLTIDLNSPNDHVFAAPLLDVLDSGHGKVVDLDGLPQSGGTAVSRLAHTAVVLPIHQSGQERLAGFLIAGISARRALDDEYRAFLDLVVTQVASAIAGARTFEEEKRRAESLAELDRAKTAFFSNVSHEFRTPLTLMLGPVDDMLVNHASELRPIAKEKLEVASRNGLRLLRLVNSLLDFSRIEAGRVRASFRPTNLSALTADLASVFRAACEKAGILLVVDTPPLGEPVFVDAEMWEKILLNLLSNAFKFTFEGEIVVTLRKIDHAVELTVSDTGTGIPAPELPRVFERFHRVREARGRTHEGSGIGLALVQDLVKLHGGSISVVSVIGEGTTFTVTIPLGSAHLPADQVAEQSSAILTDTAASPFVEEALRWLPEIGTPDSDGEPAISDYLEPATYREQLEDVSDRRPLVLVADDNADMRRYVSRLLGREYRVQAVADGEAALEAVRKRMPDLVLTDVMMPRLDGFGVLETLRANEDTRGLPVIMLSARAGEELRVEGLQAGADDYLVKPFSARELLARVGANLQMSRMRRETEHALRQRAEQVETLINQAPLGVYLVDADFRIRQVNPIALPVFGDIRGGVVGRDLGEILHIIWEPGYADELVGTFRHTLETGEPYVSPERTEYRIDRHDTEHYEWRLDRILLPDGRHGVVCYFRDISQQVNARLKIADIAERLRLAVDSASAGTFMWNVEEDRAEPDERMRMLFGAPADGPLTLFEATARMIHPDDSERYLKAVICAIDPGGTGQLRQDVRVVHADGSERWVSVRGLTHFDGDPPRAIRMAGMAADITDRKLADEQLQRSAALDAYRVALADALRQLTDPETIQAAAAKVLGQRLVASRSLYADVVSEPDSDYYIVRLDYCAAGIGSLVGRHRANDFGATLFSEMRAGRTLAVNDIRKEPRLTEDERAAYSTIETQSFVSVPLIKSGRHVAIISVQQDVPRAWTAEEVALVEETGERTWDAVERARAEEALRESELVFRTLGEAVPDFLWMSDEQVRPVYQNPAFRRYVGSERADIGNSRWMEIIHPDDVENMRGPLTTSVPAGEAFHVEARFRRHDGVYRWFSGRGVPVKDDDGKVIRWVGTLTDVDDLKRAEAELRNADRRKDEFLATLAHELRNPLAPLRNGLELIKLANEDRNAVRQARVIMERQLGHMVRLIDDLLDVSRISRGKLDLRRERVAISKIVEHAVETSRPLIESSGHYLTISVPRDPIMVDGDVTRLAQVVSNLLNNAAKYTERGGHVSLTVEPDGTDVVVTIKDTGIGIPTEMLPKVFDLFTQVDRSLERTQGGLGIGLSLVKWLVELHDGSVSAYSAGHGMGSEFSLRLPVAAALTDEGAAVPPEPSLQSIRRRILVVDDNHDTANTLALMLTMMGNETHTVHDGLEAVTAAEEFRPSVILLDLGMPKLNGYETARRIREQAWGQSIVLVALTGWGQVEDRRRTQEVGFNFHMVKPVEPTALEELLSKLNETSS